MFNPLELKELIAANVGIALEVCNSCFMTHLYLPVLLFSIRFRSSLVDIYVPIQQLLTPLG